MKITSFLQITVILFCAVFVTPSYAQESEFYIGEITTQEILTKFSNFAKHSDDVTYQSDELSPLKQLAGDIQIKVFFGQWCHDSIREVPRVITMLQEVNNPNIKTWYYALDTSKSDPLGLAEKHNILKTPTIIVYKDGVELGRILEVPESSWPTDITALFNND